MAIIPFDPAQFRIDYPQFATLSDTKLTNTFNFSAVVLGQPVSSCFSDINDQFYWLNVTLAHILTCETNGLVGRLSDAKQGTEKISMDMSVSEDGQWWCQSPYGQQCVQVLKSYLMGGHFIWNGWIPYSGDAMEWPDYNGVDIGKF